LFSDPFEGSSRSLPLCGKSLTNGLKSAMPYLGTPIP
jgi:hypothetical protein